MIRHHNTRLVHSESKQEEDKKKNKERMTAQRNEKMYRREIGVVYRLSSPVAKWFGNAASVPWLAPRQP